MHKIFIGKRGHALFYRETIIAFNQLICIFKALLLCFMLWEVSKVGEMPFVGLWIFTIFFETPWFLWVFFGLRVLIYIRKSIFLLWNLIIYIKWSISKRIICEFPFWNLKIKWICKLFDKALIEIFLLNALCFIIVSWRLKTASVHLCKKRLCK